ncbi:hypothetical protein DPEC_G00142070 [Dallia pectoralis]|uniref:Uncharacterized protein n=1 Tax=Dallia pectoralis TaxID=75939 RepID=A0ACC2GMW5_DALPE|nr:hypothetical protein DPEC_G00142070 [Dallia pectoralis]
MAAGHLSQNGGMRKLLSEDSDDVTGNSTDRGRLAGRRIEGRRMNLSNRSKSLDGRSLDTDSRDQGSWTGALGCSENPMRTKITRADSLESWGAGENRVMSKVKAFNSAGSSKTWSPIRGSGSEVFPSEGVSSVGKASGALSFPTRVRSRSGTMSEVREPVGGSIGLYLGHTIRDRIEKLNVAAGSDKSASKDEAVKVSTRTKRFSSPAGDWHPSEGDTEDVVTRRLTSDPASPSVSPLSSPVSGQWKVGTGGTIRKQLPNNLLPHTPLVEPNTTQAPQRDQRSTARLSDSGVSVSPVSRWGQAPGRHPEQGNRVAGRGIELGTRSLDRATSRSTHIRPADTHTSTLSNTPYAKDNALSQQSQSPTHTREPRPITTPAVGVPTAFNFRPANQFNRKTNVRDWSTTPARGLDREGSLSEDVFEANDPHVTTPNSEKDKSSGKTSVLPAAGVRNKIHQFEALLLQSNAPTANYRRAFSATDQPSEAPAWRSATERATGRLGGGGQGGNVRGDGGRGRGEEARKSELDQAPGDARGLEEEQGMKTGRGSVLRSASVDQVGMMLCSREREAVEDKTGGFGTLYNHKGKLNLNLNDRTDRDTGADGHIDEPDGTKRPVTSRETGGRGAIRGLNMDTSPYQLSNWTPNSVVIPDPSKRLPSRCSPDLSSSESDDDKTPTNTPPNSPFYPQNCPVYPQNSPVYPQNSPVYPQNNPSTSPSPVNNSPLQTKLNVSSDVTTVEVPPVSTHTDYSRDTSDPPGSHSGLGRGVLSLPLTSSPSKPSPSNLSLLLSVPRWNSYEEEGSDDDDDTDDDDTDDEGTEKDEDSNYDSDSAESSVTVTSAMSQSDRRSFSLSLAELCNFGGVNYDSQSSSDSEEWLSCRSVSLSSDTSAYSCVSILGTDELDRLLDDVRDLGDSSLQNYEDVQVVVLHKDIGVGLGFTMAGGLDQNKPVTVHKVFPEGVAAKEGSIREGDRVLSINGTALSGSAHSEVLRTLKRARSRGMGVVVLQRGGLTDPHRGRTETDSQRQTQTNTATTGLGVCVWLEKRNRDLGFSLEGGVGSPLGDKPLTVQKVFQGGPVNDVSAGDEVLEIQGVSLVGLRRLEAWNLIRKLPPGPVEVVLRHPYKPQWKGSSPKVGKAGLQPKGLQLESRC